MALDYIMIGTNDYHRARTFFDAVLPLIGAEFQVEFPPFAFCYKFPDNVRIWVAEPYSKEPATPGNGSMPGFRCSSHEMIVAAYAAALANGGSDEGAPGPRPLYGPNFYGAYVRDPDGNKMSFVYNE
jgi:catechol 2,3-dioxygenase-like lactoylglutathione lyase family enzyme